MPPSLSYAELEPHIKAAKGQIQFADALHAAAAPDPFSVGWAITALFYSAVHSIRGYCLAAHGWRAADHKDVDGWFKRSADLRRVSKADYLFLKGESESFRYDMREFTWADYKDLWDAADRIYRYWGQKAEKKLATLTPP